MSSLLWLAAAPATAADLAPTADTNTPNACISAGVIIDKSRGKSERNAQPITVNAQSLVYRAAASIRSAAVKDINDAFTAALLKAKADYKKARARATTPSAMNAAETARKAATDDAIMARQAAMDALPELPLDPTVLPLCPTSAKGKR